MKKVAKLIAYLIIITLLSTTFSLLFAEEKDIFVIPEGTKFIAHRGLSGEYYQNSEAAFLGAAQSSFFFGIETDIWLTSDGIWVCCHDINPFADNSKKINEITYSEAKTLPLKYTYEQFICSFERYLEICLEGRKMPVIELKYKPDIMQLEGLVALIETILPLERVMFISFHTENIENLKTINPSLRVQTLTSNGIVASVMLNSGEDIGIKHTLLTQNMVEKAKEQGSVINVWTVNSSDDIDRYREWGVDYITTDFIF